MSRKTNTEKVAVIDRDWSDLFGFETIFSRCRELLTAGRWPQVVLIEGREGLGKRKLLAQLTAMLFCTEHRACGTCAGCVSVRRGFQSDLLWLETEGAIKVAETEQLQEHLQYQARGGSERVAVMVDIEELTDQAANRLLKMFEEPPPTARILLSCSRPRQLLPTIASRLVRWHIQPPAMDKSLPWLLAKAQARDYSLDAASAIELLERNGLAPGRAWQQLVLLHDKSREALDRLHTLLLRPLNGESLQELQELLKQQGWKANELAQHFELLLNRYYKSCLGLVISPHPRMQGDSPDIKRLRHWRKILQQVYRAGGSGHNHLNTQMVAEALGAVDR
jgi:hypothetical protein